MKALKQDDRINVTIRLPRRLLEKADKQVEQQSSAIKDRAHLIEIALTNYFYDYGVKQ